MRHECNGNIRGGLEYGNQNPRHTVGKVFDIHRIYTVPHSGKKIKQIFYYFLDYSNALIHNGFMNRLSTSKRIQVVSALVEGVSITATCRLTGVSKHLVLKLLENHGHAVALYFMHNNFCRVHKTLRVTPAMEAGLTHHVWTLEELVELLYARAQLETAA